MKNLFFILYVASAFHFTLCSTAGAQLLPAKALPTKSLPAKLTPMKLLSMKSSSALSHLLVTSPSTTEEACVPQVEVSFQHLNQQGTPGIMKTNGNFTPHSFTQDFLAVFGLDNHFQGVQTLRDGHTFVFSGANFWRRHSSLFTTADDKVTHRLDVSINDRTHWHMGGIARLGDFIAAPLESFLVGESSKIIFFDFHDPEKPVPLPFTIFRSAIHAGSVGLFQSDGHIIVAANHHGLIQYYSSRTKNIQDGFSDQPFAQTETDDQGRLNNSQSIQFIRQCDGNIFMTSFSNSAPLAPLFSGKNQAVLFKLQEEHGQMRLAYVSDREFECGDDCNFAGAAGANVSASGNLSILSTSMYRTQRGEEIRYREFKDDMTSAAKESL